ncbi:MAG TPA: hypothetical protein VG838_03660 [Opitutaceae bacterium]|nr:hypothetical protein [Opitutaceae bacterium]
MRNVTWNLALLGALAAAGFGGYLLGRSRAPSGDPGSEAGPGPAAEVEKLRRENDRLRAEAARAARLEADTGVAPATTGAVEAPATAGGMGSLERLQTLADLQQRKLANVSLPALGRDGRIQDAFAEVFDLSPAERNALQQAVDQARQQADHAIVATATVSRQADGSVVISVPPSEDAAAVRDNLLAAFAQTLGPERNAAFLALNQGARPGELSDLFGGSTDTRVVTLSHRTPSPGNPSSVSVRDEHRTSNGSTSFGTSVVDLAHLPDSLSWAAPLVPADF